MADEDIHNPFGDKDSPRPKKDDPGIFDPGRRVKNDPFKAPPDDSHWDEPDEEPSTRDA